MFLEYLLVLVFFFAIGITANSETSKPNIVVIIADDLGWNDLGFHGSNQIPTPNIDALAYNGIILNRHYVLPTCTPSRAAFITGKYPIRVGLQGDPGRAQQPWTLPLKEKILPQYLKENGYQTHLVGKWHLGFAKTVLTPTKRGFDSHFGYFNGWVRYNDSVSSSTPYTGIDARRNLKPAADEFKNRYATDVFTEEAVNVIKNQNKETPFFLEFSHVAVHAEKNDIVRARDDEDNNKTFGYIEDLQRRRFAGALQALDESVGKVMETLNETGLLENSIVLFMADNGGATEDPNWLFKNTASNWPLRGMKTSFYDGGVRGAAAIWSPLFKRVGHVSNELFHISDWLPTFVSAAGGDPSTIENIDGINQWDILTGNLIKTERKEVLVNVDFEKNSSAIILDNWKLIKRNATFRPSFADMYAGVSGRAETPTYDVNAVLTSPTNLLIGQNDSTTGNRFLQIRDEAKIDSKCRERISSQPESNVIKCLGNCLYDLEKDPCELTNVAEQNPTKVKEMESRIAYFESITEPQQSRVNDPKADPSLWGGYWTPWLDEKGSSTSSRIAHDLLVFGAMFFIIKKIGSIF
ncbi:arylsulfatase B-like [Planococcus citri]|uniref:arylsulfatase B-like n=1 Tax=Planococcus citri TaxID=170843 RepID=UPI0031FA3141